MVSSSLALPVMRPTVRMHQVVVVEALEHQIVQVGSPPGSHATMWWTLAKVTFVQPGNRQCRSRRRISRRWALVGKRRARPSYMVCPTSSSTAMAIVASQATRCTVSESIRPTWSSSPASAVLTPDSLTRARGERGPPRRMGWPRWSAGPALEPGACERISLQEPVTEALVPRGLAVRRNLAGAGFEAGLDLGVGLGRQLGRHGAVLIVEAQVAQFVLGLRSRRLCRVGAGRRAALVRAASLSSATERSLAWSRHSASVSGVATSASARTLSKEISPAQRDPTMCGMSQATLATCTSLRAVAGETPNGAPPSLGGRRPVISIGLAPVDLAKDGDDLSLVGRDPPEGSVEARPAFLV